MSVIARAAEPVSDFSAPGDCELVERFVNSRDQEAFAQIVRRHGPIVFGACHRVLRDPYDIEDVFQATFLVCVRDIATVRQRNSLASWLYGVAYRLSLRAARQRRRRRETMLVSEELLHEGELEKLTDRHDQQVIDAELNALPERYRQTLVLRYLSEKRPNEIASELGISIGAVDGLLKRGKSELRIRLLQRGITLGAALTVLQLAQSTANASESSLLIETAIQGGLAWNPGSALTPSDFVSNRAAELAAQEGIAMTAVTKATLTLGLTIGLLVTGFGASALVKGQKHGRAEAEDLGSAAKVTRALPTTFEVAAADDNAEKLSDKGQENGGSASAGGAGSIDLARNNPEIASKAPWDFKARNPNVEKIEQALVMPTEVNFTDIPLKDAFQYLEELMQIRITFDKKAFGTGKISPDTPVTLVIAGITLRSTLRLMLEPLDLDYIIQNEMLVITSRQTANETFETRVYDTGRLPDLSPKELVEIITTSVEPDSWTALVSQDRDLLTRSPDSAPTGGADGNVSAESKTKPASTGSKLPQGTARATAKVIVIRQSQRVHDEIVELLDQFEKQATKQTPTNSKTNNSPAAGQVIPRGR